MFSILLVLCVEMELDGGLELSVLFALSATLMLMEEGATDSIIHLLRTEIHAPSNFAPFVQAMIDEHLLPDSSSATNRSKKRAYSDSPLTSAIIPFTLMISNLFTKAIRPASFVRCFASAAYVLPPLPYARNALAPAISEETMKCHYDGHHQT